MMPQADLHPMLDRLSAHFEAGLVPKPAWLTTKMSDGVMERMMRMIVPCRLTVAKIEGTWKLSQNKDDAVRLRAADWVERDGIGYGLKELADLMRVPPLD
jgi:transcriptional regulator